MSNKITLASLAMDLERMALGYHRGSFTMGNRFFKEAIKREKEINLKEVKPYIKRLIDSLDGIMKEEDDQKKAEDALMYSTLFQNAALK